MSERGGRATDPAEKSASMVVDASKEDVIQLVPCRAADRTIFKKSEKSKGKHFGFCFPNADHVHGRSSTIAKAFARSLTPRINPTFGELDQFRDLMKLEPDVCAYCGAASTTWDHFEPLVSGSSPTGYIDELDNLVPACGSCNSAKGNKTWSEFMNTDARSPLKKSIGNLRKAYKQKRKEAGDDAGLDKAESEEQEALRQRHQARCEALQRFDDARDPLRIDLRSFFAEKSLSEDYQRWLDLERTILSALKDAVPLLNKLRPAVWQRASELETLRDTRKEGSAGFAKRRVPEKTLRSDILAGSDLKPSR